jgi:hypothetical protein
MFKEFVKEHFKSNFDLESNIVFKQGTNAFTVAFANPRNTTSSTQSYYYSFVFKYDKSFTLKVDMSNYDMSKKDQNTFIKIVKEMNELKSTFDLDKYIQLFQEYENEIIEKNKAEIEAYRKHLEEQQAFIPDIDLCYVVSSNAFFRVTDNTEGVITFEKYQKNLTNTAYVKVGNSGQKPVNDFNYMFNAFKKVTYNEMVCSND